MSASTPRSEQEITRHERGERRLELDLEVGHLVAIHVAGDEQAAGDLAVAELSVDPAEGGLADEGEGRIVDVGIAIDGPQVDLVSLGPG